MRFIHYSSKKITELESREYYQDKMDWQTKPHGLWISVEGIPGDYNWKKWCKDERYRLKHLTYSYEVIFKDDARILHLKTPEEIFSFTKEYPNKTRDWDAEWDTYALDWHRVKDKYQGIIIAPYQWGCRLCLKSSWYYGWDCASGCIWDLTCIKEWKKLPKDSLPAKA